MRHSYINLSMRFVPPLHISEPFKLCHSYIILSMQMVPLLHNYEPSKCASCLFLGEATPLHVRPAGNNAPAGKGPRSQAGAFPGSSRNAHRGGGGTGTPRRPQADRHSRARSVSACPKGAAWDDPVAPSLPLCWGFRAWPGTSFRPLYLFYLSLSLSHLSISLPLSIFVAKGAQDA